MDDYLKLLHWMVLNPHLAVPFLMIEYAVFYWLYYKSGENKIVKFVLGAIFTPQNFVLNCTANTIIGLEFPRETTTTARMKRWKKLEPDSKLNRWRIQYAYWICDWANKWDPGHC